MTTPPSSQTSISSSVSNKLQGELEQVHGEWLHAVMFDEQQIDDRKRSLKPRAPNLTKKRVKNWQGKKRPRTLPTESEEALRPYKSMFSRIPGVEVYCDRCQCWMDGKNLRDHECEEVLQQGQTILQPIGDLEEFLFS